jgi:hypothetical protein
VLVPSVETVLQLRIFNGPKQQTNNAGRLITAKDHASIQIEIANVDADGKAIRGSTTPIAICGRVRAQGDSDDSINRIATRQGCELLRFISAGLEADLPVLKNVWSYQG